MSLLDAFKHQMSESDFSTNQSSSSSSSSSAAALPPTVPKSPPLSDGSGPELCDWCDQQRVHVFCNQCNMSLCSACNGSIHEKRKFKSHWDILPVTEFSPPKPAAASKMRQFSVPRLQQAIQYSETSAENAAATTARRSTLSNTSQLALAAQEPPEAIIQSLEAKIRRKDDLITKLQSSLARLEEIRLPKKLPKDPKEKALMASQQRQARLAQKSRQMLQAARQLERQRMMQEDPYQPMSHAAHVLALHTRIDDLQRRVDVHESMMLGIGGPTTPATTGPSSAIAERRGSATALPPPPLPQPAIPQRGRSGSVLNTAASIFPWQRETGRRRQSVGTGSRPGELNFYSYVPFDDNPVLRQIIARSVFTEQLGPLYDGIFHGFQQTKHMYDAIVGSIWAVMLPEQQTTLVQETQASLTRAMGFVLETSRVLTHLLKAIVDHEHSRRYAKCVDSAVQIYIPLPQELMMGDVSKDFARKFEELDRETKAQKQQMNAELAAERKRVSKVLGQCYQLHGAVYSTLLTLVQQNKCKFAEKVINAATGRSNDPHVDSPQALEVFISRYEDVLSHDQEQLARFQRFALTCNPMIPIPETARGPGGVPPLLRSSSITSARRLSMGLGNTSSGSTSASPSPSASGDVVMMSSARRGSAARALPPKTFLLSNTPEQRSKASLEDDEDDDEEAEGRNGRTSVTKQDIGSRKPSVGISKRASTTSPLPPMVLSPQHSASITGTAQGPGSTRASVKGPTLFRFPGGPLDSSNSAN